MKKSHWDKKAAAHDIKQSGPIVIPQALPDDRARLLVALAEKASEPPPDRAALIVIGSGGIRSVAITRADLDAVLLCIRGQ